MTEQTPTQETDAKTLAAAADAPEQIKVRRAKREKMLAEGIDPYPVSLPLTSTIAAVRAEHDGLEPGTLTEVEVGLAGRVMYQRNTGKLCFATLQDGEGNRLQIMFSLGDVGEAELQRLKTDVDMGDHIFVRGVVGTSRRGELSIFAKEWQMAAKSLRPLPVLHTELSEESRVRQRYVDLIVNDEARKMVRTRAEVVRSLRESFHRRGYLEVETPMLQTVASGAAARPFATHMNAFDIELFMRIAPELFLKRAAVGGVERVFEINRNFRNEGADSSHSPEFAMLEAYEAYGDYNTIGALTQELIQEATLAATGSLEVTLPDGSAYDFGGEWPKLSMYDTLAAAVGEEITPESSVVDLKILAKKLGLDLDAPKFGHGKLIEELWEHTVGATLSKPTFVVDFPVETSPLTRQHRSRAGVVEKWDLYVRGFELATGYSELVDPVVQRERFEGQAQLASLGDDEAMPIDEDFLTAMEFAMPPSGGMGMGIDRLLMAITGKGIRDTILFPLVKPLG